MWNGSGNLKAQKNAIYRVVFTTLSVLIVIYIFRNSLVDASASTVQSTSMLEFIQNMFESIGMNLTLTENFVRKCAHFAEFSLLSVSLFLLYSSYFLTNKKTFAFTLLTGFAVASADETLQLFSYGRSAQFSDVLLDFSGVLFCAAIISLVILIYKSKRKRKVKK